MRNSSEQYFFISRSTPKEDGLIPQEIREQWVDVPLPIIPYDLRMFRVSLYMNVACRMHSLGVYPIDIYSGIARLRAWERDGAADYWSDFAERIGASPGEIDDPARILEFRSNIGDEVLKADQLTTRWAEVGVLAS